MDGFTLGSPVACSNRGDRLMFEDYPGKPGGYWLVSADGKTQKQMLPDGEYVSQPAWSPDDKKIAFYNCTVATSAPLYVVSSIDGTVESKLDNADAAWGLDRATGWLSDREVVFSDGKSIWIVNSHGSGKKQIFPED